MTEVEDPTMRADVPRLRKRLKAEGVRVRLIGPHGGTPNGAGRKAMFANKIVKIRAKIAPITARAVEAAQAELTQRARPQNADSEPVSFSDAVEYVLRNATRTPMGT